LYGFCSEFHALYSSAKFKNLLRFDKVTERIKSGNFLRYSV